MARRPPSRRLSLDRLEDRLTPSDGAGVMAPVPTDSAASALVPIPGPIDRRTFTPVAAAPTADGKVWVIGTIDTPPDYGVPGAPIPVDYIADPGRRELAIIRLTADGSPDPTFNEGRAKFLPDALQAGYFGPRVERLLVAPDGKLLVLTNPNLIVYDAPAPGAAVQSGSVVSRLNPDGTLDPTFGTGGQVVVDFGNPSEFQSASGLAVGPDGRVVVASAGNYPDETVAVVRLTAAGQLDPTFDGDGRQQVTFDLTDQPDAVTGVDVAVTADGKVVVGGSATAVPTWTAGTPQAQSAFAVARLNTDGSLDPTFDGDGVQFVGFDLGIGVTTGFLSDLALTPDGGVLLAGSAATGEPYFGRGVAAKLNAAGELDPTFGSGGRLTPTFDPRATVTGFGAAAVRPDGRFLLGGTEVADGLYGAVLGQFLPDGTPDPGFVTYRPNPAPPGGTYIQQLTVLPDGRVLARTVTDLSVVTADGLRGVQWTVPAWALPESPPVFPTEPSWPTEPQTQQPDPAGVFPGFTGAVRTAVADVNGDGVADTIYATGPGDARLTIVSGSDGTVLIRDYRPYEEGFGGGLHVAAGELDGDGVAEVVVAPDQGGSARVRVLRLAADGSLSSTADFFAIEDANFRGGASVAVGDFDGDGRLDLAVGAGAGGGPRVAVYGGPSLAAGAPGRLVGDFFGLDDLSFRGGVSVAADDFNGDGFADLAVGAGAGGAPVVRIVDGRSLTQQQTPVTQDEFVAGGRADDRDGTSLATDGWVQGRQTRLMISPATGTGRGMIVITPHGTAVA